MRIRVRSTTIAILVAVSCVLSAGLIDAQRNPAPTLAAAEALLGEARSIVSALQTERDAVARLPADLKRAITDLNVLVAGQEQAVKAGDYALARDQHALLLRQANRIGRALQRHYAPEAENAATRQRMADQYARFVGRADELRSAALAAGLAIDLTAVETTARSTQNALQRSSDAQLKQSLSALRIAIEQLETAVATAPAATP